MVRLAKPDNPVHLWKGVVMSRECRHEARLPGFRGPYFPGAVNKLRNALDALPSEFNRMDLVAAAAHITSFSGISEATTTDGYEWYVRLSFRDPHGSGVMHLLLPWMHDAKRVDGTAADRAIAVYLWGMKRGDALLILDGLIEGVNRYQPEPLSLAEIETVG